MNRLTVIIPTFNRAGVISRALRSVFDQTRAPDEVIVVDDGSTDETGGIIARDFPRARYLHQENRGVSAARNRGIAEATGDAIAFLDSDDAWHEDKIARQLEAMARAPEQSLCHTDEIWIRRGRRVNQMHKHAKAGGDIFERCLPRCVISPSSVLIRRRLFDEVGLFDESLPACEDYDLWLRVAARGPVLYLEEKLLTKYGGHDDQLSRLHPAMDRFRVRSLEKIVFGGSLTPGQCTAAAREAILKLGILIQGARKREKAEDVEAYETLKRRFAEVVTD